MVFDEKATISEEIALTHGPVSSFGVEFRARPAHAEPHSAADREHPRQRIRRVVSRSLYAQWCRMTTEHLHLIDALAQRVESVPISAPRCSVLWRQLMSRELRITCAIPREDRCALVLQASTKRNPPLDSRAQVILERTLLGNRRKVIAYEADISPSTVALVLKDSLAGLGVHCLPSKVPSALVMLVHAARGDCEPLGMFVGDCEHEGQRFTVLTHVFDAIVLQGLPPSQRAVMRLVASGRSGVDIAARRKRSYRTVVNQISAACLRLGVSGRLELLHRFATLAASGAREP